MTDTDARLTAALQADAPAERDAIFRLNVLMRLERARFRRRVVSILALALAAGALVATNAQVINAWMAMDVWRAWIVAAAAAATVFALPDFPIEATVDAIGRAGTASGPQECSGAP